MCSLHPSDPQQLEAAIIRKAVLGLENVIYFGLPLVSETDAYFLLKLSLPPRCSPKGPAEADTLHGKLVGKSLVNV